MTDKETTNAAQFKKCASRGCYNKCKKGTKLCAKHYSSNYRKNNPTLALYLRLKGHAKERGIDFTLTKDQWKEFCERTGYLEKRKSFSGVSLTVDRIDVNKGYHYDNIQVLTNSENVQKMNLEYALCKKAGVKFVYNLHKSVKPEFSSDPTSSNYVPF